MPDSTIRGAMTRHRGLNGRRGGFLAIFGVIYVAIGISYVFPPPTSSIRHTLAWIPFAWSLDAIGLAWITAGILAGFAAFRTVPADRLGFEALAGVAFGWTMLNLLSWLLGYAVRGWVSALIFGLIASAVLTVSGMLNPPHGRIP